MENKFKELGVKKYSIKRATSKKGHKDSIIRITNLADIVKFSSYIYSGNLDIKLTRKYVKYQDMIQQLSI